MGVNERYKDCYCHTCDKEYHHLGIMRHRKMHKDNGENCKITFSKGNTYEYDYEKQILDWIECPKCQKEDK